MDYSTILSSASKLKRNSLYKVTIAEYTKEILLRLNSNISKSHDAGLTSIEYRLPTNFDQQDRSITNEEIQTVIYYNIITELENKGYRVALHFAKTTTLLTVSWSVKPPMDEIEAMRKKVMSMRVL